MSETQDLKTHVDDLEFDSAVDILDQLKKQQTQHDVIELNKAELPGNVRNMIGAFVSFVLLPRAPTRQTKKDEQQQLAAIWKVLAERVENQKLAENVAVEKDPAHIEYSYTTPTRRYWGFGH